MGKAPCCSKVGLHKGPWSTKEDTLLTNYIQTHGEGQWRSLPKKAGLLRCGKSCRLRWMNYLRPGIKRGNISSDEEDLIIRVHKLLGNRWSLIAGRLPGRTDNEIKNYWNTHLIKRLRNAGIEQTKPTKIVPRKSKESKKKGRADSVSGNVAKKRHKEDSRGGDPNSTEPEPEPEAATTTATDANKIKVYAPKPIRVSPSGSSSNTSVDSSALSSSSNHEVNNKMEKGSQFDDEEAKMGIGGPHFDEDAEMSYFDWPLIELGDANYGTVPSICEDDDQVLIEGCHFSLDDSMPSINNMLEKVYDDFFQLL